MADNLVSFANWLKSVPVSKRPKTAAYITVDDPFAKPETDTGRSFIQSRGVRTVYTTVVPAEVKDFQPIALATVHSHAQLVVIGSPGSDLSIALIHTFIQQHYSPKAIIATSGPDQGKTFANAVGLRNTEGIMVPEGWWYGAKTFQNAAFIKAYLQRYHGTVADISQDVPEAYSVGQVLQQAIQKIHSLNNAALIREIHTTPSRPSRDRCASTAPVARWASRSSSSGRRANRCRSIPASTRCGAWSIPKPAWH